MEELENKKKHKKINFIIAVIIVLSFLQTLLLFNANIIDMAEKSRIKEDSFISMRIAENISNGKGESFDEINNTNGYQPLWVWLMVPVFFILKNPFISAQINWILCWVLFHITLFLILRFFQKEFKDIIITTCIGIILGLLPGVKLLIINGLETSLFFLVFSCSAFIIGGFIEKGEKALNKKNAIAAGVLLSLAFFTRLDSFLLSLSFAAVLFTYTKYSFKKRITFLFITGITELVITIPYLLRNIIKYEYLMPISGTVKRWYISICYPDFISYLTSLEWLGPVSFMRILWPIEPKTSIYNQVKVISQNTSFTFGNILLLILLALLCLSILFICIYSFKRQSAIIRIITSYSLIHLFFFIIIYKANCTYTDYYFLVEGLTFTIAGLFVVKHLFTKLINERLVDILIMSFLIVFSLYSSTRTVVYSPKIIPYYKTRVEASIWVRENMPENLIYGSFWPGTVSFFSQQKVINLDGICNDSDFFEDYIKKNKIGDYIKKEKISYIIDRFQNINELQNGKVILSDNLPQRWTHYPKNEAIRELSGEIEIEKDFGENYYLLKVLTEYDTND